MSSQILLRLASQIDAALPQLALLAVGRKLTVAILFAVLRLASCSPLWESRTALAFRNCYSTMERRFSYMWASVYLVLVAYVVFDVASNIDDFINCKAHEVPRPMGIYCAVSLVCFVFTSRLSTSVMSSVVMLCAKDMNILTGIACIVNFAIWADVKGTSLTLFAMSCLAGVHFVFCKLSSSAFLCCSGFVWEATWAWLAVLSSIVDSLKRGGMLKKER